MTIANQQNPKSRPEAARSNGPTKTPSEPDTKAAKQDGGDVEGDMPLPHERDQSSHMTDGVPSHKVQQAAKDVERGLEDTSKGTEMDRTYQKQR